jgi:hypothetical protein
MNMGQSAAERFPEHDTARKCGEPPWIRHSVMDTLAAWVWFAPAAVPVPPGEVTAWR